MKPKYILYSLYAMLIIGGGVMLISWRYRVANTAAAFINEMEIGNNQGFANAVFEQMMKDVGWNGGEAWCMYFVKAMYMRAFPHRAAAINRILTGSTQGTWENALADQSVFKVLTDGRPQTGDIIIWQNIKNPATGHAGIDWKRDHDDYYYTIEGNSGLGGTSEGQGVTKGHRLLVPGTVEGNLKLLGFLRLKL